MARRNKKSVPHSEHVLQSNDVATTDSPLNLADIVISHDRNVNTEVPEEVPDVSDRSVDLVINLFMISRLTLSLVSLLNML